jgi:acetyl-CoA C-acetyltransferase
LALLITTTAAAPSEIWEADPAVMVPSEEKAGLAAKDLVAVEINEAFAAVVLASTDHLGLDPATVNANGGAIALGHPIGASGARIVGHLARRLEALGPGAVGVASACVGGGQGSAVVLGVL